MEIRGLLEPDLPNLEPKVPEVWRWKKPYKAYEYKKWIF